MTNTESVAMEAFDKRYALILAGDFDLSLNQRDRGRVLHELCFQFSMDTANGRTPADDVDTWEFE